MYPDTADGRPRDRIEAALWLHSFLDMEEGVPATEAERADIERVRPLHALLVNGFKSEGAVMGFFEEPAVDLLQHHVDQLGFVKQPTELKGPVYVVFAKPVVVATDETEPVYLHAFGFSDGAVSLHSMRTATTPPSLDYFYWKSGETLVEAVEREQRPWAPTLQVAVAATAAYLMDPRQGHMAVSGRFSAAQLQPMQRQLGKAGIKTFIPYKGLACLTANPVFIDGQTQRSGR